MNETILVLVFALLVKHFIIDFCLQPPWMYLNKGIYGHLGGIAHSALHGLGTACVLFFAGKSIEIVTMLSILDFVLHYHIDWAKVDLTSLLKLDIKHPWFWILLGLDQLMHQVTYLFIVWICLQ